MEKDAVKKYLELLNPFLLPTYISQLKDLKLNRMYGNDFFLTWEKTKDELDAVWIVAEALRHMRENNISTKVFDSGLGVEIFRDYSPRTRFSFASACNLLGLSATNLAEEKSRLASGNIARETANMVSFMADVIGVRDSKYIGKGNTYMHDIADAVTRGYDEGILEQRPTLINLQCDVDHPTQTMSDMLHLINVYGGIENLRGKKIAISWSYSPTAGTPLSVPQGIVGLMTRFGMNVVLAHPEGYNIMPEVEVIAAKNAKISHGSYTLTHNIEEAFKDADIVYPKNWAPFAMMEQNAKLYEQNNYNKMNILENELKAENAFYKNWTCTSDLMKTTNNALYMHCLPVDITNVSCEHGEVDAAVFDTHRKQLYKQASHKPYVIAAMIILSKFQDVPGLLEKLANSNIPRKM